MIVLVDIWSNKIFAESLLNLKAESVLPKLKKIIKDFGSPIYEIQSDRGKELTNQNVKSFLKNEHILLRLKRGLNKASFSENAIWKLKRRIYVYLRKNLTHRWVDVLQKVVVGLNSTPLKKLGFLRPIDIKDISSSVLVDAALKKHHLSIPKEPTYIEQQNNTKRFEETIKNNSTALHINDFCYINFANQKFLDKSFDISVLKQICHE